MTRPQFDSKDSFNAWLEDARMRYETAKEQTIAQNLQQQRKLLVYSSLSDLTKYCQKEGIDCAWLLDAFVSEFQASLKETLIPGVSADLRAQFVQTLVIFGPYKCQAQVRAAVAEWTDYGISTIRNSHAKMIKKMKNEIQQLIDQEDYKSHLLKVSAMVINSPDMQAHPFPKQWPKALSAYETVLHEIEQRQLKDIKSSIPLKIRKTLKQRAY